MLQCERLDLPSYAHITLNELDEPLDPYLRVKTILRVELPHAIRIDAAWDQTSQGYWITAWRPCNGDIEELVLRWANNKEAVLKVLGLLSRQLY